MKLICYPTSGAAPEIRPASSKRAWMDETPESFAYRCLPLTIASSHGWEILSPCAFTAVWDGGLEKEATRITTDAPHHLQPISHFGGGVVTFHVAALFRTDPGFNLWVTGPVNRCKHGIAPLSGVVETDWAPYTFTMNWKFTCPQTPVEFAEGEPFCFFFPVARNLVEEVEPEIRQIDEDVEVAREYRAWLQGRNEFNRALLTPGSSAQARKWEKSYYLGHRPNSEAPVADHRIKIRLRPFKTV